MKQIKRKKQIDYSGYLFILPVIIFFVTFVLFPMIRGIQLSLYDFSKRVPRFVGFENYADLLFSSNGATIYEPFIKSLWNTITITAIAVPLVVLLSIFIAVIIYNKRPAVRSFFRGVFYIPAISSVVSVTVVWMWIYHPTYGILNYLFNSAGLIKENIDWLGNPNTALYAIIAILITTSIGQPIILYVAALGNVPKDLMEAAEIDGATPWQVFSRITWPLIKPTTLYIVVVTTINSFQIFALIQLLTSGGPNYGTSTIMYLVYEAAIKNGDHGIASAMGVILMIIIGIISLIQFKFLSTDND